MVLFEKCVGMEHVVLERLDIDAIECNETVSSQDVDAGGDDAISTWNVCTEATQIGWCLLQISEVLSEELNWVLGPIFE